MKCSECDKELQPLLGSALLYGWQKCISCNTNNDESNEEQKTAKKSAKNKYGIIVVIIVLFFSFLIAIPLVDFLVNSPLENVIIRVDSVSNAQSFFGATAQVAGTIAGLLIAAVTYLIQSSRLTFKRLIENTLSGKTPGVEIVLALLAIFEFIHATSDSLYYMAALTDTNTNLSLVSSYMTNTLLYLKEGFLSGGTAVLFRFTIAIIETCKGLIEQNERVSAQ